MMWIDLCRYVVLNRDETEFPLNLGNALNQARSRRRRSSCRTRSLSRALVRPVVIEEEGRGSAFEEQQVATQEAGVLLTVTERMEQG